MYHFLTGKGYTQDTPEMIQFKFREQIVNIIRLLLNLQNKYICMPIHWSRDMQSQGVSFCEDFPRAWILSVECQTVVEFLEAVS